MSMKATRLRLLQALRDFRSADDGNVAIMFAALCFVLIAFVGAAIDYSFANRTTAKLNTLADAAALAAVDQQALSLSIADAQATATNMFNAQAANVAPINNFTVSATVTDNGLARTAVVNYTANVPKTFMGLTGNSTTDVTGTSTAVSAIPTYIDFYLLLDNTPSMGVGATPADVATMVNHTPDQCAFACHDLTNPNNYYNLAKNLGVTMRVDVVRSATQQLMDTATAAETLPDQFRMGIYTFGSSASSAGLTTITPLTSNLSSAKTAAANIDLMTVNGQNQNNDQDTNYDNVLPNMNNAIPTPGDGSTSSSPQKILFFVSDGVADENDPSLCSEPTTAGRCQEPINVDLCTAIKARGIKIAVLYTTYLALPTNNWYNTWIAPFNAGPYDPSVNSQIAANMQSCASPSLYFEVSPTDGITQAMTALFEKVVAQARLTK
jgi:Flp pilus assembly protein TadG